MANFTVQWAQDQLVRPPRASTALENAALYKYGRDQFNYVFDYVLTGGGGVSTVDSFDFNAQVDTSSDFWITQIVVAGMEDGFTADNPTGYITVKDNVKNYEIVKNVWTGFFYQSNSPNLQNYAQRSVWPVPYGIGAGGSFNVTINGLLGAPIPIVGYGYQIYIEGFKNYRLGGSGG